MVFRFVRLSRIMRIFRLVRFARRLYILAYGFTLAAMSVFWVTFLMGTVLYICAIILVRTLGHTSDADPDKEFFQDHFGTVLQAMFTLFQLSVQPNLMEYHHLLNKRPYFLVFLVFFIIFGSFGMIALLTGVISEAMFEKNILRCEEERTEREFMFETVEKACADIFDTTVTGEQGEAHKDELAKMLPKVAKVFEENGLPYTRHDLVCMMELMDTDASGSINRQEFCRGIMQIVEEVRPMLIMELHYDSITYFKSRIDKCDEGLKKMLRQQDALAADILEIAMLAADAPPTSKEKVEEKIGRISQGGLPNSSLVTSFGHSEMFSPRPGSDDMCNEISQESAAQDPAMSITMSAVVRGSMLESIASGSTNEATETQGTAGTGPIGSWLVESSQPMPMPSSASQTLDAELEAFVRDIHDEVEHLRSGCAGLERRMEELMNESLRKRALQQKEALAAQRSCSDAVEGVWRRVGECEFAVRQLCGSINGVAQQTGDLGRNLQALLGRR